MKEREKKKTHMLLEGLLRGYTRQHGEKCNETYQSCIVFVEPRLVVGGWVGGWVGNENNNKKENAKC